MPGIKKKWIKASHNEQNARDVPNDNEEIGDEDRELVDDTDNDASKITGSSETINFKLKAKKRPASGTVGLMRGLDSEVLLQKRKRFTPPAELKLTEWLDTNLEQRTEETLNLVQLYKYYTEICQGEHTDILDLPAFKWMIKQKFGKAFGLKETSLYKTLLKERKLNQEKKKMPGGISVKDAAVEAINSLGNPWNGVRFFNIKSYIGTKYPALQIDHKAKRLKRYLETGVGSGTIDLVRGCGMAGFYKIPGGEEAPPPKPKKAKDEAKKEGDEGDDDKGENEGNDGSVTKDGDEPKENGDVDGDKKEDDAVKKEKKKPKFHPVDISKIPHGNPQKIEDTFPLAITYQSAPKACSIPRIRKYVTEKYGNDVTDKRWRQVIEKGEEKKYWEHVSGSGLGGLLHLLMDDFDPSSTDIEDQVCAAIIACHEPKSAGANSIKKYISRYHPDFNIEARPDKFRKALSRATEKKIVVQLSGIGASGTYQLTTAFKPSPTVLAGEEDSDDEEEEEDDVGYKPQGTKSRGVSKVKKLEILKSPSRMQAATVHSDKRGKGKKQTTKSADKKETKTSKTKPKGRSGGRKRSLSPLTDEEEEEKPAKSSSKKQKSPAKRGRKRSLSPLSDEEQVKPEYTPVKSKSRSRPAKAESAKSLKANIVKDGKGGNTLKVNISTTSLASKESKKSAGRGRPKSSPKKTTPAKKAKDSQSDEEEEEEEEEIEIVKKSSSKRSSSAKKAKNSETDDEEEDAVVEKPEYTPRKSQSRGGSAKSSKKRKGR